MLMLSSSFLRYEDLQNKGTLKHARILAFSAGDLFTLMGSNVFVSKVLAQNSGYDPQETLVKVQAEHTESGQLIGVDLNTGKSFLKP